MAQTTTPQSTMTVLEAEPPSTAQTDRELLRLHRRACTDFAARMRLPAWEHMAMALSPPLESYTVADLLARVADGNLAAAAQMSGQPLPPPVEIPTPAAGVALGFGGHSEDRPDPTRPVIESVRTVLAVAAGLDAGAGFSPRLRDLLWTRVVELTILGYDLQQAISAGAGLDELLVDRVQAAAPPVQVWPGLEPLAVDLSTPPLQRLLALAGRPVGRWVDSSDPNCSTGQC
ncbi:hypothetical protein [Candidatus Poriferisodalis sp.]|uniref:hypothetical protein n=1 Tax=Candidatus Poriferisodalis sp. TaxID=3101277 RepID=UPI003B013A91